MFNNKKKNNSLVMPAKFDSIVGGFGTHLIIQRNNLYGIINSHGQEVIEPVYKKIIPVVGNTFIVETDSNFCIFFNFTLLPSVFQSKEAAFQVACAYA